MKIGIEAQYLFSSNKTVVEHIMCDVLRELQQTERHQYVVFVREGDDVCLRPSTHMRIVTLKATNRAHFEQIVLPRAVLRENIQLLHCTTNTAPLFCQVPLVVSLHDTTVLLRQKSDENWSRRYRNLVLSRLVHAPVHITTDSMMEKEEVLRRFQLPEDQVHTVHPAIPSSYRPIQDTIFLQSIKEKYHLPDRYILVMGGADPAKGTDAAIKAYLQYLDTTADPRPMVMPHVPRHWVMEQLAEVGRTQDISWFYFPDRVAIADYPALYNLAGTFLCTAKRPGFCISVIEAMSCGIPVVAAVTAGSPEVAGGAVMLVDAASPQETALALSNVLENQNLHEALSGKSLERAAYFTPAATAMRWQALYEKYLPADVAE